MICANCGFDESVHPMIDNKKLCLQHKGTFRVAVQRIDYTIDYKEPSGEAKNILIVSLVDDTSRLHNTIMSLLNAQCTNVKVRVANVKFRDSKLPGK